jgi:hypothetical protein
VANVEFHLKNVYSRSAGTMALIGRSPASYPYFSVGTATSIWSPTGYADEAQVQEMRRAVPHVLPSGNERQNPDRGVSKVTRGDSKNVRL